MIIRDVFEEHAASIFKVLILLEDEDSTFLRNVGNNVQTTRHHIPEDAIRN
jgi:hypothetical protein